MGTGDALFVSIRPLEPWHWKYELVLARDERVHFYWNADRGMCISNPDDVDLTDDEILYAMKLDSRLRKVEDGQKR